MESISLINSQQKQDYKGEAHISHARWNQFDFVDVERLEFKTRLSFKAFLWIVIFASLFINICLKGSMLSSFIMYSAAIMLAVGVYMLMVTYKRYYIMFYMHDGSKTKISVPKENIDYVKRFVSIAKRRYNK